METVLEPHPIALKFPALSPAKLTELRHDIAKNGQLLPISLYEGMVLEGWHRYLCCVIENREPITQEYVGADPLGFAISMNLHRRHLTTGEQKAVAKFKIEQAPERPDREIARELGMSGNTVAAIREEIGAPTPAEAMQAKIEDAVAANPEASNREIAKKIGASDHTVGKVRGAQIAQFEQNAQSADQSDESSLTAKPSKETPVLGKKRGRSKGTRNTLSRATKEAKPKKPAELVREEFIESLGAQMRSDLKETVENFIASLTGYEGIVPDKITAWRRAELVSKFATLMKVQIEVLPTFTG
jgi:hypothetical protein